MSNIDKLLGNSVSNTYQTQNTAAPAANASQATGKAHHGHHRGQQAPQADSVTLSASARALASAQDAVRSAPDTRDDKVAAIKQSLDNGTYSVNASVLARKMLSQTQAAPPQE